MRAVLRSSVRSLIVFSVAAVASGQEPSPPPAADQVERLQAELATLRQDFSARLATLEAQIAALQPSPQPPPAAAEAPQPVAPAMAPTVGGPAPGSKVFNPDIAVIGNFLGAAGENDSPDAPPSLQMEEAEASFQAIVDPYARADFFLTFGPEEVGIEEGYITFPTVPGGLLLKVGKMRDAFGKVNAMHAHVLPWTDRPLVVSNLVGGEEGLADAGISLSRLIPNRFLFLEATAQAYQGNSAIFAAPERQDLAYVGHLRAYRDLRESSNLDLGGSFAYGHNGVTDASTSRLWGADATFRWRPLRRAIYRRFIARTEFVWSRREGEADAANAFGWFGAAEYQFARRWFAGARYDRSERAEDPSLTDEGGSLLLTWWPSEFSQIRGQFRRTDYADRPTANELLFQFLFSIGAHGAHPF